MKRLALSLVAVLLLLPGTAQAHPGVGIVMDSRGTVYYTDLRHVWRIQPDGRKSIAVANVHTHELYIDSDDNLYGEHLWYEGEASDRWGHRVWRLAPDGTLSEVIPPREGFLRDYSFVRDASGTMFWAETGSRTVIRLRTASGEIVDHAAADFRDVRWMTATAEGTLYLIDVEDLVVVERDGAVRTIATQLRERSTAQLQASDRHNLMGLWTDAAENVYVAVYGGRQVKRISPGGEVRVIARTRPPWSPTGGLVAPNGDLWLLEYSITNRARVRRISREGRVTVY